MRGDKTVTIAPQGTLSLPSVLAAAHELKAPLVLMRQLTYHLDTAGELTDEQKIVRERLRLTAERALRLVENVTRTSHIDEALFALEPLQAHSVWQNVVDEINPLARQLGQDLTLDIPRKPLLVVAHAELLPAVLTGLCDNALAHNPSGTSLRLSARKDHDNIVFSVRDKGPKVDARAFRQLESRLGKTPQPLGARPGSSGLGLWIAGAFARAMASELSVTRHHKGGMTFSLHVPISGQLVLL